MSICFLGIWRSSEAVRGNRMLARAWLARTAAVVPPARPVQKREAGGQVRRGGPPGILKQPLIGVNPDLPGTPQTTRLWATARGAGEPTPSPLPASSGFDVRRWEKFRARLKDRLPCKDSPIPLRRA